jgi:small subunit ribosomal protein S14
MIRKCLIARNVKRENAVIKYKDQRDFLRNKRKDPSISMEERMKYQFKLNKLPRNSSKCRLTTRCSITGRARGVYKKFKISRIVFREMALKGHLPGITKASW